MVVLSGTGRNRYGSGVGGTPVSIGPMNSEPSDPPPYPPVMSNSSLVIEPPELPAAYRAVELVELMMTEESGTNATAPPPSLTELPLSGSRAMIPMLAGSHFPRATARAPTLMSPVPKMLLNPRGRLYLMMTSTYPFLPTKRPLVGGIFTSTSAVTLSSGYPLAAAMALAWFSAAFPVSSPLFV